MPPWSSTSCKLARRSRPTPQPAVLVAVAALVAGCTTAAPAPPPIDGTPCGRDADCGPDHACLGGLCRARCTSDNDCAIGQRCTADGRCRSVDDPPDGGPADPDGGPPDQGPCEPGAVRACGESKIGQCRYGTQLCLPDGRWTTQCSGAINPEPERCDGLDNDCNGELPADEADADRDGARPCAGDCDDDDPTALPGASERCDGIDNNCDGRLPDEDADRDADGVRPCTGDCDDTRASVFGGAPELCDGLDNDCDGTALPHEVDADGDGVKACAGDCDDGDVRVFPGAPERCNRRDDNCDGALLPGERDGDGDGVMECAGDCDDAARAVFPGAVEQCDGRDDDCDGRVPPGELDADGDGFAPCAGDCDDADRLIHPGARDLCLDGVDHDCNRSEFGCECPDGDVDGHLARACGGEDCDDGAQGVHPGAPEVCNGADDNCGGGVDEGFDGDADGFTTCGTRVGGGVDAALVDCDDTLGAVNPRAREDCNARDDDCDGVVPAGERDGDGDGLAPCAGDCDDGDRMVRPGARDECLDGVDQDCSGAEAGCVCTDRDGDGHANRACGGTDCDDATASVRPDATEGCNGIDDDCRGGVDEGFDGDGDGFTTCGTRVGGGVDAAFVDCDDVSGAVHPGAPEVCNARDDDCDGALPRDEIDRDGDGFAPCAGDCDDGSRAIHPGARDECLDGIDQDCSGAEAGCVCPDRDGDGHVNRACGGTDCDDANTSVRPDAAESCNGIDDDCRGGVDEGFDGDGDGFTVCGTRAGGGLDAALADCDDAVRLVHPGASEGCNGADDDCDGSVPAGEADEDGDGARVCHGDCRDDVAAVRPGAGDPCDGIDNDCSGAADDGFGTGAPCDGAGACGAGVVECAGSNTVRCSTEPGGSGDQSALEVCNGRDDDCDGAADEGFDVGVACVAPGVCGAGTTECSGALATRCSSAPGASDDRSRVEVCNGADDDCDGVGDEGFGVGAACAAPGVCDGGVWECGAAGERRCSTAPGGSGDRATPEVCDGEDDDCDGAIDEDFGVGVTCARLGVCGAGVIECAGASDVRCSTTPGGSADRSGPEQCDALDNDCDGTTDEGFGLGGVCHAAGECGEGTIECAGPVLTRCSSEPGGSIDRSGAEVCKGRDDDCDGEADDGFGVGTTCPGRGTCGEGVFECAGLLAVRCSTLPGGSASQAGPDACDGRDNDCDGMTDEAFRLGTGCTAPGPCGAGVLECATLLTTRCSTAPGASADRSTPEVCDAVDNDCDGSIDEPFAVGSPCDRGGGCGPGVVACAPGGGTRCAGAPGSDGDDTPERCDGEDNDCDGFTDEGYGVGLACAGRGACPNGVLECAGEDAVVCSTLPGGSRYVDRDETCDGTDENCDGVTDEGFGVGAACTLPGVCGAGTRICGGPATTVCSSRAVAGEERCDGLDNDCDGESDEGFAVGAACEAPGECGAGTTECAGEGLVCSTAPGGSRDMSVPERCDGLDNNCDGVVADVEIDRDGDLYRPCGGDCDEGDRLVNPARADVCDGRDNDCDGGIDRTGAAGVCRFGEPCVDGAACAAELWCLAAQVPLAGGHAAMCTRWCSNSSDRPGAPPRGACSAGYACLLRPGSDAHGTCWPGAGTQTVGFSCTRPEECASLDCREGRCSDVCSIESHCTYFGTVQNYTCRRFVDGEGGVRGRCAPPLGAGDHGARCTSDADCRQGLCDASGVCRRLCCAPRDCPAARACLLVAGAAGSAVRACGLAAVGASADGTACSDGAACAGGLCAALAQDAGAVCTRTCCRDEDCPAGTCDARALAPGGTFVRVCVPPR